MAASSISPEEFIALKSIDEDKQIIACVQYIFRDSSQTQSAFKKEFIEQTIIQPLKTTFGLVGSAKFQVKLLKIEESNQTAEIQLQANLFSEFWAAFVLTKTQGSIVYKTRLLQMKLTGDEIEHFPTQ